MADGRYLFTSESVSMGHPDKMADQISDGVLDAILQHDPHGRVACETLVTTGLVLLAGEITTTAEVDYINLARDIVRDIGYTSDEMGFNADTCAVLPALGRQSPDIAMGVDSNADHGKQMGAGDQGLMFGYACDTSKELMPLPLALAHRVLNKLTELRREGVVDWLRPDSKSQVTVEFDGDRVVRVPTVVVSTQHSPKVSQSDIHDFVVSEVVEKVIPEELLCGKAVYHVNPTGRFVIGGPRGDTGLTGRKIIVDTYGGWGRHGGGAFSGKDPSKVDRSAAYMSRYVAKNVVAAGLAKECELQLAYAIGVTDPVSVHIDTRGTGKIEDQKIADLVREIFPLTPTGIIEYLDLRRPIYRKTASGGHFGRNDPDFTWEKTDKADTLRRGAGLD